MLLCATYPPAICFACLTALHLSLWRVSRHPAAGCSFQCCQHQGSRLYYLHRPGGVFVPQPPHPSLSLGGLAHYWQGSVCSPGELRWQPLCLNLAPCFILAFSLAALETNCYWLSLYCCRVFHLFVSLFLLLPHCFSVCSSPNGTMAGAALCMAVISFYGVAMRDLSATVAVTLLGPSLYHPATIWAISLQAHIPPHCRRPAVSFQSPAKRERMKPPPSLPPALHFHSRNKSCFIKASFFLGIGTESDLLFKNWTSPMVFQTQHVILQNTRL